MASRDFAILSLPDLVHATGHIDRSLLPYYLLLHGWQELFGAGAVSLRLPSVVAAAVAVAFTADAARRLWGLVGGAVAGVALALDGVFLGYAVEARPYALVVTCVALATWALVVQRGLPEPRRWPWGVYAVATGLAVLFNVFAVLVVPVHVLLVRRAGLVRSWLLACVVPVGCSALALASSWSQREQVGWVQRIGARAAVDGLVGQTGLSRHAALLALALLLSVAVQLRDRSLDDAWLTAVGLLMFPALALFVVSLVLQPVFVTRYLATTTYAAALLLGSGARAAVALVRPEGRPATAVRGGLAAGSVTALGIAALVVTSAPGLRTTVSTTVKYGDDFVALDRAIAASVRPGEALVVPQTFSAGGFAGGVAYYGSDAGLADAVEAALRGAGEPNAYLRRVTGTADGRFVTSAVDGTVSGVVWMVEPAFLAGEDLVAQLPGCAAGGTTEQVTQSLALVRLECTGSSPG